jgi:hypothetical protein
VVVSARSCESGGVKHAHVVLKWRWGVRFVALAAMVPVFHEYPPIVDFPEHAATIATVMDIARNGPLARWYELDFIHTQYWLMAVAGAALSLITGGAVSALKILVVGSGVGLVAALQRLARALEIDERWAAFAIPLLWSRPLVMGFLPFLMSLPLTVLALAEMGAPERPAIRRHALVASCALAIFFLNLTSVVWLVTGGLALAWSREREVGGVVRRLLGLWILAPLVLGWLLFGAVTNADTSRFAVDIEGRWWSPAHVLREAPMWLTDIWHSPFDRWLLAGWLLLVGLALFRRAPNDSQPQGHAFWLWLSTFALCLALPFERGWLWGLSMRFLPVSLMLVPLVVGARRPRWEPALHWAALGLTFASLAHTEVHVSRSQDELKGLDVLRGLPTGSRLLQLNFDEASRVAKDALPRHAGAYHRVWNQGPNEPSFVDLPQSAVHYREGLAPWMRPWPWETKPEEYDNAKEGPFYDFVLVRGSGSSFPPPPLTAGPQWTLWRENAGWSLYRRNDGRLTSSPLPSASCPACAWFLRTSSSCRPPLPSWRPESC